MTNASTKITKRNLDALRPAPTEQFVWDGALKGFGVRVRPSGAKIFIVQFRANGRNRRMHIGDYGRLTVDQARAKAFGILNQVALGEDPAEAREIDRKAMTLQTFIEDHYLPDAKKGLVTYRGKPKKATTLETDRGRITRHIVPLLGRKKVRDLRPADVSAFIEAVARGDTAADVKTKPRGRAIVDGGPGTARRTVGLLGGILSYAVQKQVIAINPARGVDRRFSDGRKTRSLSPDEFRHLGDAIREAESVLATVPSHGKSSSLAAIKFAALTGFRKSEVLSIERGNIDGRSSTVHLRDSKSGEQFRPIGAAALAILAERIEAAKGSVVFSGSDPKKPIVGIAKAFERLCAAMALEGVTLQTLRHSFASVAAELGYSEFVIAGLLGHRAGSVTHRYSHLPDLALRQAADRVAAEIERRMKREGLSANVVEIRHRRAVD